MNDNTAEIAGFYEEYGWVEDGEGHYFDDDAINERNRLVRANHEARRMRLSSKFRSSGGIILDVGSGPHPYLELAGKFDRYVCLDISRRGLIGARRKLGDGGSYVVADMTNLPFRAGAFAAALCAYSLIHLDENGAREAINEMNRVSAKDADIIILTYNPRPLLLPYRFSRFDGVEYQDAAGARRSIDRFMNKLPLSWYGGLKVGGRRAQTEAYALTSRDLEYRFFKDNAVFRALSYVILLFEEKMPKALAPFGLYAVVSLIRRAADKPREP